MRVSPPHVSLPQLGPMWPGGAKHTKNDGESNHECDSLDISNVSSNYKENDYLFCPKIDI